MSEVYRNCRIYPNPCNINAACDWLWYHDDYDGADDANDNRHGYGESLDACKRQIDEMYDDMEAKL